MTSIISIFLFSTISLVAAADFSLGVKFNRKECYAQILNLVNNGTLSPNDEVFFRDNIGLPMFNPNNLTLTLSGCQKLCGPKQGWYPDIGPRLETGLFPILLLISNIELSPLDKRRFLAIVHLLGDPIDSIWSLIHKIDAWDRCYSLSEEQDAFCGRCKRVIATVFAGFEEIEGPKITSPEYFDTLRKSSGLYQGKFREWRRTAGELADGRTDEFLRTCLATLLYICQVIATFDPDIGGGNTSPPGGRIGTTMFISWLVPAVLLSNVIGGFTSRRTCFDILSRFAERTNLSIFPPGPGESTLFPECAYLERTSKTEYLKSLGWSGAIYSFRPWKTRYITCERDRRRTALILFLSISPICIGMAGAFIIMTVPNGFDCRHIALIGIFLAWFVSAFITWLPYSLRFATGKYHWRFTLVKDALIAIPSIVVIFLSSCGLFNSCFCWSGFFFYGDSAHVSLSLNPFYDNTFYPAIVGICLFLQLSVFVIITTTWRHGLKLMRWSERAKREQWENANERGPYKRANGSSPWSLLEKGSPKRLKKTYMCCQYY